ncbi:MAG TPA: pyridoxamine 5'-phosphate oxidase family protein [Oxalicibacterium sp.]|uniref:pyridoxamine 5'-phosphate oxidase family protein n=1 Tax=Oxalicibacterium sp. TaxID=2766525 RepID=UPI002CFD2A7C|nr:pyridoxamine 5'-phosphate oxidase family protein [Oxalicibacterium sp.]HWU99268.1 pyridoxamine 5'-phosphate oxidase family protein [Oxalicibacterium sp.]
MDSINAHQPEHNRADLADKDAQQKLKEMAEDAKTCFFCTASSGGGSQGMRPMSTLQVDDQGNLWFLSASDSRKNAEIAANAAVKLLFQGSKHSEFLTLDGVATVSRDKAKIKELWGFLLKTWFTEGENDPRITVIKVTPIGGYYWDTKHGSAVAGIKMVIGATIGKTLDDSIEGTLKP